MSHQDELTDEFFANKLTERLRKMRPNRNSSGESGSKKPFRHLDMIGDMQAKALCRGRDLLQDVLRLIAVYWRYGSNNTTRILEDFEGTAELKQRLIDMIDVYDIQERNYIYQTNPSLSRIAEAFPQISLVLAGEINANPATGLKLWVTDQDLGYRVHYLFKLNFFPSLIYVDAGVKAQACLLLFNLCYAKCICNMYPAKANIVSAFEQSCSFSTHIMDQHLAPLESRLKFTDYIKDIAPSAELMYKVWIHIFAQQHVPLNEVTAVTLLHEKVLGSQPLYLVTWKKLLADRQVQ